MASIISIISFVILLLVTYSYSLPVEQLYDSSTTEYEFTSGTTMVDNENGMMNMPVMSDEQSTYVPDMSDEQSTYVPNTSDEQSTYVPNMSDEQSTDNVEFTTVDQFEYPDDVSVPSTTADDLVFTSSWMTVTSEMMPSNDTNNEYMLDDNTSMTMNTESTTQFDSEVTNVDNVESDEVELSTMSTNYNEMGMPTNSNEMEMSTNNNEMGIPTNYNEMEMTTNYNEMGMSTNYNEMEMTTNVQTSSVEPEPHMLEVSTSVEPEVYTSTVSSSAETESDTPEVSSSSSSEETESHTLSPVEHDSHTSEASSSFVEMESSTSEVPSSVEPESHMLEVTSVETESHASEETATTVDDDNNGQSSEEPETSQFTTMTTMTGQVEVHVEEVSID
ncbi:unnamed protein product [Rotaria sordida]|uniref:Zonadhesin n=1 Tax=Rotaria sordida TaxID=392033 RepID=A0A819BX91_9BILA|nr:unnamed protein product [Rotaria sordida]